jgi:hypothetical protein
MEGKKGSEKYYIIISMILGLIVLSLSLWFIFNEYFNQDELDYEVCRQSVILRNNIPSSEDVLGWNWVDLKSSIPLKCKTEVIEINSVKNLEEVYRVVANTVASIWSLSGMGERDFSPDWLRQSAVHCVPLARIHFSQKAIQDYENSEDATFLGGTQGFETFYKTEKVPGRSETYEEFLPMRSYGGLTFGPGDVVMIDDELIEKGSFVRNIEPFPGGDLIFVYRAYKFGSYQKTWGTDFLRALREVLTWTDELSVEQLQKVEKHKSIFMVPSRNLDMLGCTVWEGIPA